MIRGLFRHPPEGITWQPLVWSKSRHGYLTLSSAELQRLQDPFSNGNTGNAKPEGSGIPWLLQRLRDRLQDSQTAPIKIDAGIFRPAPFPDARAAALLKNGKSAQDVAICHDLIPWQNARIIDQRAPKPFREYLQALARCREVICISVSTQECLLTAWSEENITAVPTRVLPWPVDFSGDRPSLPPPASPAKILFVSSLSKRKNHTILLEACDRLWSRSFDFELVLVGRLGKDCDPIADAVGASVARGRPVTWLKHIDEAALAKAYQEAFFSVFPSVQEGFGLPVLESLWHGRPVICTGDGAVGEIAAGGGCLVTDVENPVTLSQAIQSLLEHDSQRKTLQEEAQERSFLRWSDYVQDLAPILRD